MPRKGHKPEGIVAMGMCCSLLIGSVRYTLGCRPERPLMGTCRPDLNERAK